MCPFVRVVAINVPYVIYLLQMLEESIKCRVLQIVRVEKSIFNSISQQLVLRN